MHIVHLTAFQKSAKCLGEIQALLAQFLRKFSDSNTNSHNRNPKNLHLLKLLCTKRLAQAVLLQVVFFLTLEITLPKSKQIFNMYAKS